MTSRVVQSNEDMASNFIVVTCQLLPKWNHFTNDMHNLALKEEPPPNEYFVLCGSLAEFYIRPLNTCISDVDFLECKTDELAFTTDVPVLPSDISGLADTIRCYKILSYNQFPGFVQLRLSGAMTYNWKHKEYTFNRSLHQNISLWRNLTSYVQELRYRANERYTQCAVCGPAIKIPAEDSLNNVEKDFISCMFCPQWPRDATNWIFRLRNYGWPTNDTISEVVQNGCHIVSVQHRSCRDDESQWRLSFSLAEVILLRSWTQTQQIVYHLLRFFAKRELIQKDCPKEDEVLCSYHLKTLMLWICEEMPPEWWNSSSVIAICSELLKKLLEWLHMRYYPNYFIPEANLFHQPSKSSMLNQTERRLNEFLNSDILSRWFVENYIVPFTQTQSDFLSTSQVASTFLDYMLHLLEYRKAAMSKSVETVFHVKFFESDMVCRRAIKHRLLSGLRSYLEHGLSYGGFNWHGNLQVRYLPIIEKVSCFKYCDVLLYILHTANGLRYGAISWDSCLFVELVNTIFMEPKIIRSLYHNFPKTYSEQSSRFHFLRAQGLMENLTGSNNRSAFQLLSLMSKESLRKTLETDGLESNGVTIAAMSYLAALHFATTEYQHAMRLCLAVLSDKNYHKNNETLNAACLLFIDDVARIIGLYVLHRKIIDNDRYYIGSRVYLDLRLSPGVFSHYLLVLSAGSILKPFNFYDDSSDSEYPVDVYLNALRKMKCAVTMKPGRRTQFNIAKQIAYRRTDSLTETQATRTVLNHSIVTETVIDLLLEIAFENMTSFYNGLNKDFQIQCNTVDCYRAVYLYKCRQYDEVLQQCERILDEPDLQSNVEGFSLANVFLIPPFDTFFDGDVQSLLGFHTLFYYLSPLSDDLHKIRLTNNTPFEQCFRKIVNLRKRGLFIFLAGPYHVKCHYFLGRHFLARYLKVRCCIDCSISNTEAMTEFAAQTTNLPFELIIRRFLLRRHPTCRPILKQLRTAKEL